MRGQLVDAKRNRLNKEDSVETVLNDTAQGRVIVLIGVKLACVLTRKLFHGLRGVIGIND